MEAMPKERLLSSCGPSLSPLGPAVLPTEPEQRAGRLAASAEPSCFAVGTMILMADGGRRPIETLRAGDWVVGRRGRVNLVLALHRTRLGERRLHGFNGGRPFVTAELPFLTVEGWKALDPEASGRRSLALAAASLQLGDALCCGTARLVGGERRSIPAATGILFLQGSRLLEQVTAVADDPDLPLFDLRLDGDGSYIADGWIVHG